jgi:hypothetical protein
MRFMAVVGIVGGFLLLGVLVLGIGLLSAARGLGESAPQLAGLLKALDEAGPWLYFLLAVVLLAAVAALWQSFALYHAGDHFDLVARTDDADLDYLARGMDNLRTYFKVQVLVVLVTAVVALATALVLVAVTRPVP